MATDELATGYKKRRSSLRGSALSYVTHGTEVQAKWPKKRGPSKTQKQQDRLNFFTAVQFAYRRLNPEMKIQLREAVAGTPLLPRDLWLRMAAGRFANVQRPDGKVIYSMASVRDVTIILDAIAQNPGSVLARGDAFWEEVAGDTNGFVLTSNGPTKVPSWKAVAAPAIGSLTLLATQTLAAPTATVTFAAISQAYKDLIVVSQARSNAALSNDIIRCRLNNDATANYDFERENRFGVAQANGATFIEAAQIAAGTAPASAANSMELQIDNYAATVFHKSVRAQSEVMTAAAANGLFRTIASGRWRSTTAVARIDLIAASGQFVIGSTFQVYGRA